MSSEIPQGLSLLQMATAILDATVSGLSDAGVQPPDRQCLQPGGVMAYDGDQLVVVWQLAYEGLPGQPNASSVNVGQTTWSAQFEIVLLRSVPVINEDGIPSSRELTESTSKLLCDAQAMRDAVFAIRTSQVLQELIVDMVISPITSVPADGGLSGCQFSVVVPWW